MSTECRHFTGQCKDPAVEMVLKNGKPAPAVAQDLGILADTLRRWVREH